MVELLRRHGGVVSADTAANYRQTDLARQMLADEALGVLSEKISPARPVAEELLRFGASGGDPGDRTHGLRTDRPAARRTRGGSGFWQGRFLSGTTYLGCTRRNREFDRETYLLCFRILERCDANLIGGFGRTALHEVAAMGAHVTEEEAEAFTTALLDAGARMDVRTHFEEHAARLGVPLGPRRSSKGDAPAGCGSDQGDAELWARPRASAEKMETARSGDSERAPCLTPQGIRAHERRCGLTGEVAWNLQESAEGRAVS